MSFKEALLKALKDEQAELDAKTRRLYEIANKPADNVFQAITRAAEFNAEYKRVFEDKC